MKVQAKVKDRGSVSALLSEQTLSGMCVVFSTDNITPGVIHP